MEVPVLYNRLSLQEKRDVRNHYVHLQGDKCFFCKSSLAEPPPQEVTRKKIDWNLFPPNFLKYPVHLQHCHNTGWTEGAVHAYCNAVSWEIIYELSL